MELVSEASVAIVGADIMGNAIVFNLARLGCLDVPVFDKGTIGGGGDGKVSRHPAHPLFAPTHRGNGTQKFGDSGGF